MTATAVYLRLDKASNVTMGKAKNKFNVILKRKEISLNFTWEKKKMQDCWPKVAEHSIVILRSTIYKTRLLLHKM